MIVVRGNSTKSRILLDCDFDEFTIVNTLTGSKKVYKDLIPRESGLYYSVLLDFTGLKVGEYKYTAKLGIKTMQTGLLVVQPFDEEEEPVQVVSPTLEKEVITYQNS